MKRFAYLLTHHPELTHTFIDREIQVLSAAGMEILPISINPPREASIVTARDRAEKNRTYYLKTLPRRHVIGVVLRALRESPIAFVSTLMMTSKAADFSVKTVVWRFFHLIEALLVRDYCRRMKVAHIHAHFGLTPANIAWFTAEFSRRVDATPITWSFTIHGFQDFINEKEAALGRKAESASYVICISDYTRSQLMRVSKPEHWDKYHVVRCGIDVAHFGFTPKSTLSNKPTILTVARLSPEKGHVVLIRALQLLREAGVDARVEFVGGGPSAQQLEAEARECGVADSVIMRGALAPHEVAERLRAADIFCLPSFAEGLPVSIMEAMAVGVPVVTTFISGIPELAEPGETAIVVPAGSPDALAQGLLKLIDSAELRCRLVHNARKRIEREYVLDDNAMQVGRLLFANGGHDD